MIEKLQINYALGNEAKQINFELGLVKEKLNELIEVVNNPMYSINLPTKPVECQHEWFYSSPPHRDQRCKKCEEHRIEPPDNLEKVIDDFFGVRYNQYVVDCWKEPLADKIREWIKCELKGMKKKQSDVLGMPIECNEGYNQCLEDITGKLCGE